MREYKDLFMFNTIYNVLPTFGYTILDEGHGGRSSPHYGLWGSEISTLWPWGVIKTLGMLPGMPPASRIQSRLDLMDAPQPELLRAGGGRTVPLWPEGLGLSLGSSTLFGGAVAPGNSGERGIVGTRRAPSRPALNFAGTSGGGVSPAPGKVWIYGGYMGAIVHMENSAYMGVYIYIYIFVLQYIYLPPNTVGRKSCGAREPNTKSIGQSRMSAFIADAASAFPSIVAQ